MTSAARLVPEPVQSWMSSSEIAGDLETRNKLANASAKRTFFIMLIFQFCPVDKIHGTVLRLRDQREAGRF